MCWLRGLVRVCEVGSWLLPREAEEVPERVVAGTSMWVVVGRLSVWLVVDMDSLVVEVEGMRIGMLEELVGTPVVVEQPSMSQLWSG